MVNNCARSSFIHHRKVMLTELLVASMVTLYCSSLYCGTCLLWLENCSLITEVVSQGRSKRMVREWPYYRGGLFREVKTNG